MDMQNFRFSGYDWIVKTDKEMLGPGPNYFCEDTVNIHNDELELQVSEIGSKLFSAEVILNESLGYGKYVFYLSSRVDLLSDNLVLGLFTWDKNEKPHHNEIDIEFSRWGRHTRANSQYVVQPYTDKDKLHRFDTKLNGDYSTNIIEWKPKEVNFMSIHGHFLFPPTKQHIIDLWSYKGNDVPKPKNEQIHINLWKYGNSELKKENVSLNYVRIKGFEFQK